MTVSVLIHLPAHARTASVSGHSDIHQPPIMRTTGVMCITVHKKSPIA